jgi:hypothetical protein
MAVKGNTPMSSVPAATFGFKRGGAASVLPTVLRQLKLLFIQQMRRDPGPIHEPDPWSTEAPFVTALWPRSS